MFLDFLPLLVFASVLASIYLYLKAKKPNGTAYRSAIGLGVLAALLLFWVNGAVGIIGSENNDANMMYAGVIAIAFVGGIIARFEPNGMKWVMLTAAMAQVLVAVIALVAQWGVSGPIWPNDVIGATVIFVALWLGSAWLFRRAAQTENFGSAINRV